MLTRKLWSLLSVLMVLALVLSACAPAATPAADSAACADPGAGQTDRSAQGN